MKKETGRRGDGGMGGRNAVVDLKSQISEIRKCAKFSILALPGGFVHKSFLSYVGSVCFSARGDGSQTAQFLAHLSPRQIAIAAAYLDGFTQSEIAEQNEVDQTTVSRELSAVRGVCVRFGRELPKPLRVKAQRERQLSAELYKTL